MRRLLKSLGYAVAAFPSAAEFLASPKRAATACLVADVQMPAMTGAELYGHLLETGQALPTILVTAYPQYAMHGYEHGVVDYLLKPVSPERLKLACEKALEWWVLRNNASGQNGLAGYLYIKSNGRFERIGYDEIRYLEAANNYVIVHTGQKKYLVYQTLKGMEKQLPAQWFLQTHKSFIVARPHIRQIDQNSVSVGDTRIPLSRRFKQQFLSNLHLTNNNQPVK